ncbi:MAG: RNA polymerase sigma factor for flagellar operon, partial [uncultured Solirubrobacteraceae bacterium]
ESDRPQGSLAAIQDLGRRARTRAAGGGLLAARQVRGRPHVLGTAGPRRGGRPHLLRPRGPHQRDRALRSRARDQVRDLRDHPHQGPDHRRAALAGLGAAVGAGAGARDRARPRQARAQAASHADRRGDRRRALHLHGGVPGVAAADLQLDRGGARRAVVGVGLLGRPGVAARHAARSRCSRSRGAARRLRGQGPALRRDRGAAGAREARDRPLLLREPDAARDRRGPGRHRVARLPAAHQGGAAAQVAPPGRPARL